MWMKSYMVEIGRHDDWVSSITAWSTTIPRFLCGLCQCIKIKPTNVYYIRARAQFKINTQGCWNQHSFKTGCPVPPRPGHWSCVFGTISVAWNEYVGQMAAGDVASVWGLRVRSPIGPRQFLGSFVGYMHFPLPQFQNHTNQYYRKKVDMTLADYTVSWQNGYRIFAKIFEMFIVHLNLNESTCWFLITSHNGAPPPIKHGMKWLQPQKINE